MSTQNGGPRVIINGLSLYIDAYNDRSYIGTGLTCSDLSISNLTGIITGASFSQNSFLFNGTSNYITITPSTETSPRTNNFSISSWFNTSVLPNYATPQNSNILSNYPPFPNTSFYAIYVLASGYSMGYIRDKSSNSVSVSNTTNMIVDGKWHNATLVRDGFTSYLYVDGILDSSSTNLSMGDLTLDTNSLQIGRNSAGNGQYFNGYIQNAFYYKRALTASEVLKNYNALKSRYNN